MTPLEVAKLFLKKGPPYYGTSDWKDSKLLGRKEGGAGGFFDGTKKQFYAKSNDVLVALLKTEKWKPVDAVCVSVVLKLIREAEKADAKKQKLQSERVEQPERAQTAEEIEENLKRTLFVPADEPGVVKRLREEHGVTEADIHASRRIKLLGPRSGISDARRVQRALKLGVIDSNFFRKTS